MVEEEVVERARASAESTMESQGRPKRRLRNLILGIGATLIVIGIALAIYVATQDDEPFLIALAPAFLGVVVVIAALFGKRL